MRAFFIKKTKIIKTRLSTFRLAGRLYVKNLKRKYKNIQILVNFPDPFAINMVSVGLQALYTFLENYPYILLFL